MLVPEHARQCVVFIGTKEADKRFQPRATGFFVSYLVEGGAFLYLVTAEHVISGLSTRGHDIWVRVNFRNGEGGEFRVPFENWRFHPDETKRTDVAVASVGDQARNDETGEIVKIDLRHISANGDKSIFAIQKTIDEHAIGPGEEIAIIGLFRNHFGAERNIPIVRTGNIAMMKGEPVFTSYAGWIDAYLIEARSIGGLSGSPVFVNMPPYRIVNNQTRSTHGTSQLYLLGLVHGHFDVASLKDDAVLEDDGVVGGINTGIGIVIPAEKILETIDHPDWRVHREKALAKKKKESAAIPDLSAEGESKPSAKEGNPAHKEAFKSLLGAAAKKRK